MWDGEGCTDGAPGGGSQPPEGCFVACDPGPPDPGPDPGPQQPTQPSSSKTRPIDYATDRLARSDLRTRLQNFSKSNCNKVFSSVIEGYSASGLAAQANSTEFYNVTNPAFGGDTQDSVAGNGVSTALGNSLSSSNIAATVLGGSLGQVFLLGANFFSNSNAVYQDNVLLHELLHAYTGWNDAEIFSAFVGYGLAQTQYGGTENISAWLSTDCKSTPTGMTWWNQ